MDTIPAPLLAQEHLTEGTRESESWQDTEDEPEGHPQMALQEVRPETASSQHKMGHPGPASQVFLQRPLTGV